MAIIAKKVFHRNIHSKKRKKPLFHRFIHSLWKKLFWFFHITIYSVKASERPSDAGKIIFAKK
jgi:hypothetical protein